MWSLLSRARGLLLHHRHIPRPPQRQGPRVRGPEADLATRSRLGAGGPRRRHQAAEHLPGHLPTLVGEGCVADQVWIGGIAAEHQVVAHLGHVAVDDDILNRDEDPALDGDDCAPADAGAWVAPVSVTGLVVDQTSSTDLFWSDQGALYDILGGAFSALRGTGIDATACVEADVSGASFSDLRVDPAPGVGYYYLVRAVNACGSATLGAGRESVDPLDCTNP